MILRAGIAQSVVCWRLAVLLEKCHGFDPALSLSGSGDFSLGVNMDSDSIP